MTFSLAEYTKIDVGWDFPRPWLVSRAAGVDKAGRDRRGRD